jgi:hypothetical protein
MAKLGSGPSVQENVHSKSLHKGSEACLFGDGCSYFQATLKKGLGNRYPWGPMGMCVPCHVAETFIAPYNLN